MGWENQKFIRGYFKATGYRNWIKFAILQMKSLLENTSMKKVKIMNRTESI